MINLETGRATSEDDPATAAMMRAWNETTLPQRQAWHRFTCQNSRAPLDMLVVSELMDRIRDNFLSAKDE